MLFNKSKYTKWYWSIINTAKSRQFLNGYVEKHHLIPQSLGGSDEEKNLVYLSAKEHYICHHLLTKMCISNKHKYKMWYAFFFMHTDPKSEDNRYYTARSYSHAKKLMSEAKRNQMIGESNHFYGKKHSGETKQKMSKNWNKKAKRNVDKNIYTFSHKDHGIEKCTREELCSKYNISQKRIYTIVKRINNTACGWRILWENEAIIQEEKEIFTEHP